MQATLTIFLSFTVPGCALVGLPTSGLIPGLTPAIFLMVIFVVIMVVILKESADTKKKSEKER